MLPSWGKWLNRIVLGMGGLSKKRQGKRSPGVRRYLLRFEDMEDRVLPSIYYVTNTQDSGAGSLRQGILSTPDTIDFNIPTTDPNYNLVTGVFTITPASALPQITTAVLLDGTSQPGYITAGYPVIDINGSSAGASVDGLDISAANTTIKGLAINGFSQNGIAIFGQGNDSITGNFIGTDATGTSAMGNGTGILVYADAGNNTIGGTTAGAGNVISGNTGIGLWISGQGTSGNLVQGNFIGTNASGTGALSNGNDGVLVDNAASDNTIGGTRPAAGNLISGNTQAGIQINGTGSSGNVVEDNLISTNISNTSAVANGIDIQISGAASNNPILNNTQISSGSWTELSTVSGGLGTMLLLPNGDLMVQENGTTNTWYQIAPDSLGSYLDGTLSTLAPMSLQRLYDGSAVLPNGDVMVYGGEYSGASGKDNDVSSGQIYDPATNTWKTIASIPKSLDPTNEFGDNTLEVLPNGNVLAGYINGTQTFIYNPTTNTWSAGPTKLDPGVSGYQETTSEETWVKLPGMNGNILDYELWASLNQSPGYGEYLNTATNTWVATGSVPVPLTNTNETELGPAIVLPNGQVFQVGANGTFGGSNTNTALYDPITNSWAAGPTIPGGLTADDAAAAILPDSNVIFAADSSTETSSKTQYQPPTELFEYAGNSITQLTLPSVLSNELAADPAYVTRMLVLPSGQIALADDSGNLWLYSESQNADVAWAPTITNITSDGGGTYILTGTQLNGLDEGASYGDDAQMAENYPIVQLTNTDGNVFYATTSNWSSTAVATGSTPVSTEFTLPSKLSVGDYSLRVIADGISSSPIAGNFNGTIFEIAPTVTGINPTAGSLSGGTMVTITGTDLANATAVDFGTNAATIVSDTATQIVVASPAGSTETVDVTVTTAAGTSSTSAVDQFTYTVAPTVTGIGTTAGPPSGGTTVTIIGTDLANAMAVDFGTNAATIVSDTATQIVVASPAGSAGTMDVTVTTAGGTSTTSAADQFTYTTAPTVTGINPIAGSLSGGTTVTIAGTDLANATAVDFGTNAATIVNDTATEIVATCPAGTAGTVDVTVTTVGGTSETSAADLFTYGVGALPVVYSISPPMGSQTGDTSVTINGANFTADSAVMFGTKAATNLTVISSSEIIATAPPRGTMSSTVDVTVTNSVGSSHTSLSDEFTFIPPVDPATSTVSVSSSPIKSGSVITVTLQAKDASRNDLSARGLTVTFKLGSITGGKGTFSSVTDNGNGTYTATFTGTIAGNNTIKAIINGHTVTTPAPSIKVMPGAMSLAKSVVAVSSGSVKSDSMLTVTLQAKDAAGNKETTGGLTVLFTLANSGGSQGIFSAVKDNENGTYTATFIGTIAGTNAIAATIGGQAVTSTEPSVTVTPGPVSLLNSFVSVSSGSLASGSKMTITLQTEDAHGNLKTSGGLKIAFEFGSASGSRGVFSTVKDNKNGTYTATFTGTIAGSNTIVAMIGGLKITSTAPSIQVTPGPVSLVKSLATVSSRSVQSGNAITITLQAKDAAGNNETSGGLAVAFALGSTKGGQGTFSAVTDNGNGTYTAMFTGTIAGSNTIKATIDDRDVTSTAPSIKVM